MRDQRQTVGVEPIVKEDVKSQFVGNERKQVLDHRRRVFGGQHPVGCLAEQPQLAARQIVDRIGKLRTAGSRAERGEIIHVPACTAFTRRIP